MFSGHYYHEHIKRAVAVFGTLFNNMSVVKKNGSGNVISTIKVPLAYGPRQKFLARIQDEKYLTDPKLAIRLPRMSFEIVSMTYDTNTKLQKGVTRTLASSDPTKKQTILNPVGYRMGLQLNIMTKNQDEALQLLEQILPYFQPEYTVTVKEVQNNFKSDMPFVLQSVTMSDDYEGDFLSRRAIIYTLEFETRVRFYGPLSDKGIIRRVDATFADTEMTVNDEPYQTQKIYISPSTAQETDDYDIEVELINPIPDTVVISFTTSSGTFTVGESVTGSTSGTVGRISAVTGSTITVDSPDGRFTDTETVTGVTSAATLTVDSSADSWVLYDG
jgi:hypothetical protein